MKQKNWLILASFLIIIDQAVKWFLIKYPLFLNQIFPVSINNKFILGYGPSLDLFFWISIFLILIIALFIIEKPAKQNLSFSIMLAGALSNLIDRLFRGGVVDYFKVRLDGEIHFNLADLYLILGLIYYLYLLGKNNEEKSSRNFFRHK